MVHPIQLTRQLISGAPPEAQLLLIDALHQHGEAGLATMGHTAQGVANMAVSVVTSAAAQGAAVKMNELAAQLSARIARWDGMGAPRDADGGEHQHGQQQHAPHGQQQHTVAAPATLSHRPPPSAAAETSAAAAGAQQHAVQGQSPPAPPRPPPLSGTAAAAAATAAAAGAQSPAARLRPPLLSGTPAAAAGQAIVGWLDGVMHSTQVRLVQNGALVQI